MDTKTKADSVAAKINKISAAFDIADNITSTDVQEYVDKKTTEVTLYEEDYHPVDVMTLQQMADDFKYSRETLKEVVSNGRRVLQKATLNLMDADSEESASMTLAFAELNTAVLNGIKVQSQLYRDFSNVLLNMKKLNSDDKQKITNNLTINTSEQISTVDLIKRLRES